MKRAKVVTTACFTVLIGALALMNARAQDFVGLEKSILTFSAPVELPNLTLQPGTYMFKRAVNDANNARIIQVFNEDGSKILGTFQTIPTRRLEVSGENVVTFKETREGMTPAVHYWYYPGKEDGHEFVYSKQQAMTIAQRTGQPVMSTEGEISASGVDDQALSAQAATPSEPAPAPVAETQIAANVDNSQGNAHAQTDQSAGDRQPVGTSGVRDEGMKADSELPHTASPLPLTSLIGLLSLGGAATLRRLRRR